jgi:hypothetical protein
MHEDDPALLATEASADGILQCLHMLAAEAADLRLASTLQALRDAIAVCQNERAEGGVSMRVELHSRLH